MARPRRCHYCGRRLRLDGRRWVDDSGTAECPDAVPYGEHTP